MYVCMYVMSACAIMHGKKVQILSYVCSYIYLQLLLCLHSDGTLNPNGVRFGTAELYDIGKQ